MTAPSSSHRGDTVSTPPAAPQPIDGATALRLLREVVAERPDYVYEEPDGDGQGCVYVWQGTLSCIVAHVLARAGWTVQQIAELDMGGSVKNLAINGFTIGSASSVVILDAAQSVQDTGDTWAEALAAAEEKAAQLGVTERVTG